ncbi:protein-L-isoaspartate(D-aspartate) O-methyltransferase [Lentisalinibacter sediminis]|uniref:protein-L-isoaspartate(D-aspartate) O-methyltransferase n=1 Tax=Lentisalinibacter sediminis TaxID=2992237 RepID=UPI00386D128F
MDTAAHARADELREERDRMVERQIEGRGVRSAAVLEAMRRVPREAFLPEHLREFAYDDNPLPIGEGQTISQPYIVAMMIEALALEGGEKVLEIGAGSGYAAAILGEIAGEVYTIERVGALADRAGEALASLGYDNVHVLHADGTLGWADAAPFDAIVVAAAGPAVPDSLKSQLKVGGRLVIPIGPRPYAQELVRVTRVSESDFATEDLADVRFVPLVGEQGWENGGGESAAQSRRRPATLEASIAQRAEPFDDIAGADLDGLMARIGDARIVLLGEASHGTSEFYRMRARITRELIERKGFSFMAIEGDWPDAGRVDHYIRHLEYPPSEWTAFARFPTWMWRNAEVRELVEWLRRHNGNLPEPERFAFYGLDLYSLYTSIRAVLRYLDDVDPETAALARRRYGCLTPWQTDPATYGHAALTGSYRSCEEDVVRMLTDLLERREEYVAADGERFLDAMQNARLVANAERYYRSMYYGSRTSWNLRDTHMFDTLSLLLDHHGPAAKAVVWAHNSHIGDADATEMSARGETNIGRLCREAFGEDVYSIGFGTHGGTVAAASDWDGPMEVKIVRPSLADSYERLMHDTGVGRFLLDLSDDGETELREALSRPRLERAIGVIYRPEAERMSHYFEAVLPRQFDEYVWFDRSRAVTPLATDELEDMPDTYPFGL